MKSDALYDALTELFDLCVVALADTPDGAPECRHLTPGPPSWDVVPSLFVWAGGPAVADTFPLQPALAPAHRVTTMGQVDLVSITATILRCAPMLTDDGGLPSDQEFTDTTRQTSADLWAIWNHIKQAKRTGQLFGPPERELFMDPAVAVAQQGGACGWNITLRTQLDGYRPA